MIGWSKPTFILTLTHYEHKKQNNNWDWDGDQVDSWLRRLAQIKWNEDAQTYEAILGTVFGDLLRHNDEVDIGDINLQVAPSKAPIRKSLLHTAKLQVRLNGLVKTYINKL